MNSYIGGVTIGADNFGTMSNIEATNINSCVIVGGSINNPNLYFSGNEMITIQGEIITAKEWLDTVRAIKALREIYPEHFI